jgi:hypothetical protein
VPGPLNPPSRKLGVADASPPRPREIEIEIEIGTPERTRAWTLGAVGWASRVAAPPSCLKKERKMVQYRVLYFSSYRPALASHHGGGQRAVERHASQQAGVEDALHGRRAERKPRKARAA